MTPLLFLEKCTYTHWYQSRGFLGAKFLQLATLQRQPSYTSVLTPNF